MPDDRSRPPQRSLLYLLLPLAPIVVAIGIAIAVRHPANSPATTAATTQKPPGLAVGVLAPDFSLWDVHNPGGDEPVTLSLLAKKSPVLIVFILGYNCVHCVSYLKELDARRADFEKMGVKIIVITPDSPANLRDSIHEYGDVSFPFLSDMDSKVARAYGLRDDHPLHGTYLVDTQRHIAFAAATEQPFEAMDQVLEAAKKLSK